MRREPIVVAVMAVAASSVLACRLFGGSSTSADPTLVSSAPRSGLDERTGEILDLVVPLWGGGVQDLADLRGRPVLLELADATSLQRESAQARYRALVDMQVDRQGEVPIVVSVALDADVAGLPPAWTDDRPPFILGWDPQGALAARLQLVVLPTVILLDAAGTIVAVHEGSPPDDQALQRWLLPD
ncbi:MAG: hypothetical protein AAGF11_23925 [Myxococcota bacterium]